MSKILIAGDWHGNHVWAKKIIDVAHAEGIDKMIQLGDFGVWPGKDGQEYLYILSRYLVKKNVKLYFVPGNHEDFNQIEDWEKNIPKNEDGHIEVLPNLFYAGKVNKWQWEGKVFASVGGAVSIDRKWRKLNESWWKQEQLTQEEEKAAIELGKVDYLFSHDCPTYHPFRGLKVDYESELHRAKMNNVVRSLRPDFWFHGHMHEYSEYYFSHENGEVTKVFALDADDKASDIPRLQRHTKVLDAALNETFTIDKLFNWYGREFYFDRRHSKGE